MKIVALKIDTEEILDAVAMSKHRNLPQPKDALVLFCFHKALVVPCKTKERLEQRKCNNKDLMFLPPENRFSSSL